MKNIILLLLGVFVLLETQVAQAAEPTIFEVSINDLKTGTPVLTGTAVLKADNTPTGMTLYSGSAIDVSGLRCTGATTRLQLSAYVAATDKGGYLELPMLKNPSTLSFSSYYSSSGAAGRPVVVYKKVKGGDWQMVDTVKPLGGTATVTCLVYNINVYTLDSVSLKIEARGANVAGLFNTIKVTGVDMAAPELATANAFTPMGNDVPANTSALSLKFNQAVLKNTGSISLFKNGVGTAVKVFDVATDAGVSVVNDSTLQLSGISLTQGTSYYVLVDSGVVKGKLNEVAFANKITNAATWAFTTSSTTSAEKDILSFSIPNQDSSKISGTNITTWVKYGTNVAQLTCDMTISTAASVTTPAGWTSSTLVNFSTPQTFTITAENGTTKNYTITVVVNKNTDAKIKSMDIKEPSAISITSSSVNVRTMATITSIPQLTINAASDSKITFRGTVYGDTVTLNNADISGSPIITVVADNGTDTTKYTLVATSADTAVIPATFKGVDGSGTRWNSIVTTAGWIGNAPDASTTGASSRSPYRITTSGSNLVLHYDSIADSASYYIRAYNLTTYNVIFQESANGIQWDTISQTSTNIPSDIFVIQRAGLKKASRYIKWTFANLAGSGSLMFDEVHVSKFVPSSAKAITQFTINGVNGTINEANKAIAVTLPFGTNVNSLTPTVTLSSKATVSPLSGVAQNFSSPVTYVVTAENGSVATYTVTLTLGKQPVTLTLHDSTYVYNGSARGITADVSCGGVTPAPVVSYRYNGSATKPAQIGVYAVKAWSDETSTFAFGDTARATLTINAKQISVTGLSIANKTYDGTVSATVSSWGTLQGKEGSDIVSINQTGVTTTFGTAGVDTSKAVSLSTLTLTGAAAGNYTLTQPSGLKANITAAALTITANNQSKQKGETKNLGTTAFSTVGLKASDNVTAVTLTSAGIIAAADTGKYDIVPSNAQGSGLNNYAITYVKGTLTVTPTPVTAIARNTLHANILSPNPAQDFVNINLGSLQGAVDVKIYDLRGVLVLQQTLQGGATYQVGLQQLTQGLYVVSINGSSLKLMVK